MTRVSIALLVATATAIATPAARAAGACEDAYVRAQERRLENPLVEAHGELVACASPACADPIEVDCVRWLAEVERDLPTVVLVVQADGDTAGGASVQVDGSPTRLTTDGRPAPIDPGKHKLSVTLAGRTIEREIVVVVGQKNQRVELDFRSRAPRDTATPAGTERATIERIHPVTWVFAGATVVSAGVLAFAGISALQGESALKDECGTTRACQAEDLDTVYTYRTVADVSLGVGAGFAVATVIALSISLALPESDVAVNGSGLVVAF